MAVVEPLRREPRPTASDHTLAGLSLDDGVNRSDPRPLASPEICEASSGHLQAASRLPLPRREESLPFGAASLSRRRAGLIHELQAPTATPVLDSEAPWHPAGVEFYPYYRAY